MGILNPELTERLKYQKKVSFGPHLTPKNGGSYETERFLPAKLDENMRTKLKENMYEDWIQKKIIKA